MRGQEQRTSIAVVYAGLPPPTHTLYSTPQQWWCSRPPQTAPSWTCGPWSRGQRGSPRTHACTSVWTATGGARPVLSHIKIPTSHTCTAPVFNHTSPPHLYSSRISRTSWLASSLVAKAVWPSCELGGGEWTTQTVDNSMEHQQSTPYFHEHSTPARGTRGCG